MEINIIDIRHFMNIIYQSQIFVGFRPLNSRRSLPSVRKYILFWIMIFQQKNLTRI